RHQPQYVDAKNEGVRPVTEPSLTPVRVEKALGLLPEIEALEPLRALLVSISRPDERTLWSSSGPYLTLGKRGVQPEELRHRMPQVFHTITEHLQGLYGAYVEALECQQRADGTGAVAALLRAGRSEERVARLNQARAGGWEGGGGGGGRGGGGGGGGGRGGGGGGCGGAGAGGGGRGRGRAGGGREEGGRGGGAGGLGGVGGGGGGGGGVVGEGGGG